MEKKEKTSISIDKEVLNKIREKAKEDNRNVSNLTEILYKDFLKEDTLKKEQVVLVQSIRNYADNHNLEIFSYTKAQRVEQTHLPRKGGAFFNEKR